MAVISPTPARHDKLAALAEKLFRAFLLSPTDAGLLAGKATVFDSSCLGMVGRAAAKQLRARQHSELQVEHVHDIGHPGITLHLQHSRSCHGSTTSANVEEMGPVPLLYADPQLGDKRFKASDLISNSVALGVDAIGQLEK